MNSEIVRDKIVQAALSYEGTRWCHQARQPGVGMDCAGVVICAYREAGLKMMDDPHYSPIPDPVRMREYIEKNAYEIDFDDALPGDFVWLKFSDPQHLGVLTHDFWLVHAYLQARRVIVQRWDAQMQARLVATFRHRSLN